MDIYIDLQKNLTIICMLVKLQISSIRSFVSALKFGSTLPQSDKAANLGAVRFAIVTVLGASWFPLSVEMFLNPSFVTKTNLIVFISELFWKFEVKLKHLFTVKWAL